MESITQIKRSSATTDSYGEPIVVETPYLVDAIAVSARVTGSNFNPDEIVVTEGLTLYLPAGTVVDDNDLFLVRGRYYEVDGEAFDWKNGLGSWNPGVVVDLQRQTSG